MNEDLLERFGRSRSAFRPEQSETDDQPRRVLNPKVREYFEEAKTDVDGGAWLTRSEIPTSAEILDIDKKTQSASEVVELEPNRRLGPWESKDAYLGAMYELLREDAIAPLREAVSRVKHSPNANEDAFDGTIGIYEKVHICGVTCASRGLATKVTFSLKRTGKKILWEQSKRLVTGSLVVLTPIEDMFRSKAVVATVAARPVVGLMRNPPEIDLFIARAEEQEFDPAQEWIMIQDRSSLYEASKHTLLALQKMMREPFPLSEHLIDVQKEVSAPMYVEQNPRKDMTAVFSNREHNYENVDILNEWPEQLDSNLDESQLAALRRILTKRLAIVQGPPGTGKTYISVQAIRIMLANRRKDDTPIIIACQTNHAVDQILRHVALFEPEFVRLGGRSKDREIIKPRTLYEVRRLTSENPLSGSLAGRARRAMKEMENRFKMLLSPLRADKQPLDFRLLEQLGLLTTAQADSLEKGASQWVQDTLSIPSGSRSPFHVWLRDDLIAVPPKQVEEDFGFEYEEADLEFEALRELEAENLAKDDEDFEKLRGEWFPVADNYTCKVRGIKLDSVKEWLKQEDMWKIPEGKRPAIYKYLQGQAKKLFLQDFRGMTKKFNEDAMNRRIGFWEHDETLLKRQKVIGMTTTGFSKYRGLIAALKPKVVLIEEAAETLEAPVTVTCLPSLQHLILVGDHQQLRPHCNVRTHEDKPYFLNVSLFERLVKNDVEFDTLSEQRRMIPEIRRILHPIYRDLIKDHHSVTDPLNRPNVLGMGGVNSFFFTHQWSESRDEQMSAYNSREADMIAGFVEYLIYNGTQIEDITVLTFYNGQRKRLHKLLRTRPTLGGQMCKIVTVDSYQGEENKVILLSLVRSNDHANIGFLNIENRVCVALSRAQCGFYIFGNGSKLYEHRIWEKVIRIIANEGSKKDRLKTKPVMRIGEALPVRCNNHHTRIDIEKPEDFDEIVGGCTLTCGAQLPCGHACPLTCHPFPHYIVSCPQLCVRTLPCGHECEKRCGDECICEPCAKIRARDEMTSAQSLVLDDEPGLAIASDSSSWRSFAEREPQRYAAVVSIPPSQGTVTNQTANKQLLVDLSDDDSAVDGVAKMTLECENAAESPYSVSPAQSSPEKRSKDGKRKLWKETLSKNGSPSKVKVAQGEDWSKRESLLD